MLANFFAMITAIHKAFNTFFKTMRESLQKSSYEFIHRRVFSPGLNKTKSGN